jgi:L-gulonate 5-dehydrogenase
MRIGTWEAPTPDADEVVVQVKATGICAGDLYIYQGRNPYAQYPIIGGHEIAGYVRDAGRGVSGILAGELVVVEPFIGCGRCYACRAGKPNCCVNLRIIGVHQAGGFADYVVAPAKNIHRVPAGLTPTWASFAEPIAIGVQAARRGDVHETDTVLILGAGPIGLALIEVAQAKGAKVYVTDIARDRLDFAQTLGAEPLASDETLFQRVMDLTGGEGMPCVIEATGSQRAMESTVDLVANGGRIVIVGLLKRGQMIQLPGLDLTRKEMTVHGSRASTDCFPEALSLLASGKIRYPKVATEFDMWDAPAVFSELNDSPGKVHKGVLVIQ